MTETDKGNVIDWLNEIISNSEWQQFYSESETRTNAENALELIRQADIAIAGRV